MKPQAADQLSAHDGLPSCGPVRRRSRGGEGPRGEARLWPSRAWVDDGQLGLADLGYEGEADLLRIPIKKPTGGELTADQQAYNAVHGALRCLGERANSLLKTTSAPRGAVLYPPCSGERLKEVSLDPMALPELERERGP